MNALRRWWNGERLGDEVALVLFAPPETGLPLLGAAASEAGTVLLIPADFPPFLQQHAEDTLICYDAAKLHWPLEAHFRQSSDTESLKRLWAYSAWALLTDIDLLDQHVRRCCGAVPVKSTPLNRLVQRRARIGLPDEEEVRRQVVASCRGGVQNPDDPALELAARVAHGIFDTYRRLVSETIAAENAVAETSRLLDYDRLEAYHASGEDCTAIGSLPNTPPEPDRILERLEQAIANFPGLLAPRAPRVDPPFWYDVRETKRAYGPLGIGIEVKAAIALRRPDRHSLRIDSDQAPAIRQANDRRFERACSRLREDARARRCFRWNEHGEKVLDGGNGSPGYHPKALKAWLQGFSKKFCDMDGQPISIPLVAEKAPSFEPEDWTPWAACDPSLRAWRDLVRSCRVTQQLDNPAARQVEYGIVPTLRARAPDLTAFRSLGVAAFTPEPGKKFLVGTFPHLMIRSFYTVWWRSRSGIEHHTADLWQDRPFDDVIQEFLVNTRSQALVPAGHRPTMQPPNWLPPPDYVAELRRDAPEEYRRLRCIAECFLDALALNLPDELLKPFAEAYDVDLMEGQAQVLWSTFLAQVFEGAPEDFAAEYRRTLERLADLFERPRREEEIERLAAPAEFERTAWAALRNALVSRKPDSHIWRWIHQVQPGSRRAGLTDDQIVDAVLKTAKHSVAGRVIARASYPEARRRQVAFHADEVMKSLIYHLVAHDLPLVAVAGNQFVLELPESEDLNPAMDRLASCGCQCGLRCCCKWAESW